MRVEAFARDVKLGRDDSGRAAHSNDDGDRLAWPDPKGGVGNVDSHALLRVRNELALEAASAAFEGLRAARNLGV